MKGVVVDEIVLKMASSDNVVTTLDDLPEGATFGHDEETVELTAEVQFGHKIAVTAIEPGTEVVKYGEVIGKATDQIAPGEWVHTHNCESTRGRGDKHRDGVID